jgi:ABC-type nitrate/sulfonate/bicarbonate transport system substrate-binding protein
MHATYIVAHTDELLRRKECLVYLQLMKMRSKARCRNVWTTLALLPLLTTVAAAVEPAPLRVQGNITTIELAPVLLAAQSHNAPVAISNGGVPDLARAGGAELATNAETQALRASVTNPDLRIIMTVSEGLYRIVARRSAGINSLADLKGKRIATISITSSGYFLHRMLRTVGLDYADVTVVPLNTAGAEDAIARGEIDAVSLWEPMIDNISRRLGDDAIEFSGKGIYREIFNLNTTAAQLADPVQRQRIVEFVRSVLKSTKQLHADPRFAWTAVAKSAGYDESVVARTWHHHRYPGAIVPDLLDVLEDEEKYLARSAPQRTPRSRAELAKLIDASVLEEALAGHPELRVAVPAAEAVQLQAEKLRVERLSASVRHATALRAAKRLQNALNHYREAGLWQEAAALFTRDATGQAGEKQFAGAAQIAGFLQSQALAGTGRTTLGEGDLNTHLAFSPVVTVDPDGRVVRGRWRELSMTGRYGATADWADGIYENEYVEEGGVWKIRRLHYYPGFVGPYTPGWRNADKSDKVTIVPFHYSPDGAGTPIPLNPPLTAADKAPGDAAGQKRRVAQLTAQLACLQAESKVRSLQNAYGFYMDRRMWDDIADLYADDGSFEPGQRGVYRGRASIRHALEQIGPRDLAVGVINDHTQMQPVVTLSADCRSATLRGTEFVMAGQNGGDAAWGINLHDNTYRLIDGKWRLQTVHVYQRMRSDYAQGWAKSALPVRKAAAGYEADEPTTVTYAAYPAFHVPPMPFANPGKDGRAFGRPSASTPAGSLDHLLASAERELDIVVAQDGAENVSNAYGYYIDEFLWDNTADMFSVNGSKELAGVGNYIGRERVRESMVARYGRGGRRAASMTLHQKTEPVVTVAPDGRSARIRNKLLQLNSSRDGDGSYLIGIYENNIVRERGVWKISRMDLDYTWNANYSTGWARVTPPARRAPAAAPAAPAAANNGVPPDGPLRGAPAAPYPELAVMAFHYKNPVSGRDPPELLPP